MENQVEVWKSHPEIDKIEVSSFGRVRSVKGHCYKITPGKDGYMRVCFRMNGKLVSKLAHRLVAETFLPNPGSLLEVNHLDRNIKNNDVSNLEWIKHEREYCIPRHIKSHGKK